MWHSFIEIFVICLLYSTVPSHFPNLSMALSLVDVTVALVQVKPDISSKIGFILWNKSTIYLISYNHMTPNLFTWTWLGRLFKGENCTSDMNDKCIMGKKIIVKANKFKIGHSNKKSAQIWTWEFRILCHRDSRKGRSSKENLSSHLFTVLILKDR